MEHTANAADAELMASTEEFSKVAHDCTQARAKGSSDPFLAAALEAVIRRVEAACADPAVTQAGLRAAYAVGAPAADLLIGGADTEAVAFSLRGRGDKGDREVEAEVMGDGDVVPALGTGSGGAGHRFVAVRRWVRT